MLVHYFNAESIRECPRQDSLLLAPQYQQNVFQRVRGVKGLPHRAAHMGRTNRHTGVMTHRVQLSHNDYLGVLGGSTFESPIKPINRQKSAARAEPMRHAAQITKKTKGQKRKQRELIDSSEVGQHMGAGFLSFTF